MTLGLSSGGAASPSLLPHLPSTSPSMAVYGRPSSRYTDSSVPTTIWGPGTLAGRAILALGEATLKGLDRIIDRESRAIQRRLALIRAFAPHLAPEMYNDLVELSRPDLYPHKILGTAAGIIFRQIDFGYMAAVALSLLRLPPQESRLVILQIFKLRFIELKATYDREYLAEAQTKTLDLLTMIIQVQPDMTSACFEVLDRLFEDPSAFIRFFPFRDHPVVRIHAEEDLNIPLLCRTPLSEQQLGMSEDRRGRWRSWELLENAGLSWHSRLMDINTLLLEAVSEKSYWTPSFFDAAVDLFDFISFSKVPEAKRIATDHLMMYISISEASWGALGAILHFVSGSDISVRRKRARLSSLDYGPYITLKAADIDLPANTPQSNLWRRFLSDVSSQEDQSTHTEEDNASKTSYKRRGMIYQNLSLQMRDDLTMIASEMPFMSLGVQDALAIQNPSKTWDSSLVGTVTGEY